MAKIAKFGGEPASSTLTESAQSKGPEVSVTRAPRWAPTPRRSPGLEPDSESRFPWTPDNDTHHGWLPGHYGHPSDGHLSGRDIASLPFRAISYALRPWSFTAEYCGGTCWILPRKPDRAVTTAARSCAKGSLAYRTVPSESSVAVAAPRTTSAQ